MSKIGKRNFHEIKLQKEFAKDVFCGAKCFEIRKNDRVYKKGDFVKFQVVDFNGNEIYHILDEVVFEITYVLSGWGLLPDHVAFGIKRRMVKLETGKRYWFWSGKQVRSGIYSGETDPQNGNIIICEKNGVRWSIAHYSLLDDTDLTYEETEELLKIMRGWG